jgi:multisubunit Na+/H+ antiporter MnhB subunit
MAETKTSWLLKTLGLVILAAVVTALLTTWIQMMVWDNPNGGVSGGAAAGVAVAIFMARRRDMPVDSPPKA